MLEVIDNADVLHTILNLPEKQEVGKLLKFLLDLLPPITPSSGKLNFLETVLCKIKFISCLARSYNFVTSKNFPNLYLVLEFKTNSTLFCDVRPSQTQPVMGSVGGGRLGKWFPRILRCLNTYLWLMEFETEVSSTPREFVSSLLNAYFHS